MVEHRLIRLWADRGRLAQLYLEHPAKWPDGINTKYGRWYSARETYWAQLAKRLDKDGRWQPGDDDQAAYAKWADEEAQSAKLPPKPRDHKRGAIKPSRKRSSTNICPPSFASAPRRPSRPTKAVEGPAPSAPALVDEPLGGRPRLGPTPMTAAERKRPQRIKKPKQTDPLPASRNHPMGPPRPHTCTTARPAMSRKSPCHETTFVTFSPNPKFSCEGLALASARERGVGRVNCGLLAAMASPLTSPQSTEE